MLKLFETSLKLCKLLLRLCERRFVSRIEDAHRRLWTSSVVLQAELQLVGFQNKGFNLGGLSDNEE